MTSWADAVVQNEVQAKPKPTNGHFKVYLLYYLPAKR